MPGVSLDRNQSQTLFYFRSLNGPLYHKRTENLDIETRLTTNAFRSAFVLRRPYAESSLRDRQLARASHRNNLLVNIARLFLWYLRELRFRKEPADTFSLTRCIAKLEQVPRDSGKGIRLPPSNSYTCILSSYDSAYDLPNQDRLQAPTEHVTKRAACYYLSN